MISPSCFEVSSRVPNSLAIMRTNDIETFYLLNDGGVNKTYTTTQFLCLKMNHFSHDAIIKRIISNDVLIIICQTLNTKFHNLIIDQGMLTLRFETVYGNDLATYLNDHVFNTFVQTQNKWIY